MANGHGGARARSGRKPKLEKHAGAVAAAEKKIADKLPKLVDNMVQLANGGYERVEETFERKARKDDDGNVVRNAVGETVYDMVPTGRRVVIADKDRAANEYLINRILGKPTEHHEVEADVSGEITVTTAAQKAAEKKLNEWREKQKQGIQDMMSSSPAASQT